MTMMKTISKIMLKKIILSLVMVCISLLSMAATYYVSNTGNDLNSGLTTALPWQTLSKVNSKTFVAGDQILFQRGNTFYGSLTIKNSGAAGNPITFGAYGTGANPVITGFTEVTAWTNLGGNIWESTYSVSGLSTCNMVVINGVNTAMGRFPNSNATNGGYLTFQSHSGKSSITSSSLSGTPNWTGAEVVIRATRWNIYRSKITSHSGNTLSFATLSGNEPNNNFGFFIQNRPDVLDTSGEWYYDPASNKIRTYSQDKPQNFKITSIENLIHANGSFVSIEFISFQGANQYVIYNLTYGKSNLSIKNCSISFSGRDGIHLTNSNLLIENCNISDSNNNGIDFSDWVHSSIIRNCTITNSGVLPGMGQNADAASVGISSKNTSNNNILIERCQVFNSGYHGICFYGTENTLRNNFIDTFCTIKDDGAGIYTWGGGRSNLKILSNLVFNGVGAPLGTSQSFKSPAEGIYLDDNTSNVEVSGNSVYGCAGGGIFLHNANNNIVSNNNLFNNFKQLYTADDGLAGKVFNNTITNNFFIARLSTQKVGWFYADLNNVNSQSISLIGTVDNNYYARPIDDNTTIVTLNSDYSEVKRTLEGWKTFTGLDVNSKKSPQTITSVNDFQFEYNATTNAKTISLSQPMIDFKGTKYVGSITLQPFTSIVLMKDAKPAKYSTEYKSICDGLSYNGWTTTGKYERTLVAKTGADSIVTTYLTVNPKYAIQEDVTILSGETYNGWNTSGTYTRTLNSNSGCDSVVTTTLIVDINTVKDGEITQTIELKKGNNMISTYLQAINPDVSAVTQTIRDSGNLIKMQNESGNSYENWGILGGWINNLGSVQNTEGYKVMVANNCTIQITGQQIVTPLAISLNVGWNIISFPKADILDAKMIVQSLIDQNALVKVQDEIGNSIEDWGIYGGWKNGIGNFIPGKGYRVKVSKNSILTILDSYPKSAAIPVYSEQTLHFHSLADGNGSDHMNINLVGLSQSGLEVGDELAAFDGDLCVGTLKITDQHLMEGTCSLIASCSTDSLQKDGFFEGSSIQLQLWNQTSGKVSPIQVSLLSGSSKYLKNDSMLGKLKSLTTSATNLVDMTKIEVFPNPSQGRFTVNFSDIPDAGSRIDVLDLSGRRIATHLITGISEELDITGQAAGLYLVKSILGLKESINKIVIQ
jgi:parallel beta-helix repeat protein